MTGVPRDCHSRPPPIGDGLPGWHHRTESKPPAAAQLPVPAWPGAAPGREAAGRWLGASLMTLNLTLTDGPGPPGSHWHSDQSSGTVGPPGSSDWHSGAIS